MASVRIDLTSVEEYADESVAAGGAQAVGAVRIDFEDTTDSAIVLEMLDRAKAKIQEHMADL